MAFVLDAGALIAIDSGNRNLAALIVSERRAGRRVRTHGGVIAQVWRNGSQQAILARVLDGVDVVPLDEGLGRRAGVLLGAAAMADAIDAALVAVARSRDVILTSDPVDIERLCESAMLRVDIRPL